MYIYIIHFPNNKKYVGQTKNINRRLKEHRYDANKGKPTPLHRAIAKYGWENLIVEIIATDELSVDKVEIQYISAYNTKDKHYGYNLEGGGNQHKKLSDETKEKIRVSRLGSKRSQETKDKISKSLTGRKLSTETITKISQARKIATAPFKIAI